MALHTFQKNAGIKLLQAAETKDEVGTGPATAEQIQQHEKEAAKAILDHIASYELPTEGLTVAFDSSSATVTLTGKTPDQESREKIILCSGNIQGVQHVDDQMEVGEWALHSDWHSVRPGETLADIAQHFYRDAQKYWNIFEANQPMMTHPDKVYAGQMLRVPPATRKCYEPTILFRKNRTRPSA